MTKLTETSSPENAPQTARGAPPARQDIELRAYQIYVERGGAHGQDAEDWLQAECELVEKYSKVSLKTKAAAI